MRPHSPDEGSPSERLRSLEKKAQAIRSRLTRAVDLLDERRHQAVEIGTYARKAARPAMIAALGAFVVIGAGVLAVRSIVRARRRRGWQEVARRYVQRLDLVPQPSLASRIFEKAAVSLATMIASELVGISAKRLAHGAPSGPRVA